MATLRTYDEKLAIVKRCVELEKSGGDVLGYLWSEDYLTPRATWFNFQREWLGRKPYEYTDGKPKKGEDKMDRIRLTDEEKLKAAELAISGGGVYPYLESLGAKNPSGMWRNIKGWIQKNDPELFAKIPGYLTPGPKVDKGMPKQLQLEGGVNYELAVAETPEAPKITKPVNYSGFDVSAIRDRELGEFYFDHDHNCIDWRNGLGDEISLGPIGWKILLDRLPKILQVLGVDV